MDMVEIRREQLYDTVSAEEVRSGFIAFANGHIGNRDLTNLQTQGMLPADSTILVKRLLVGGPTETLKTWANVGLSVEVGCVVKWRVKLWSPPDKDVVMDEQQTPMGWTYFGWDFTRCPDDIAAERALRGEKNGIYIAPRQAFSVRVDPPSRDGPEPQGSIRIVLDGDRTWDVV